jgi:RNA-directed DNA polymerase
VSSRPTELSRGLAAAFLDGPWGINALVARGADGLGRRARGLLHLARAVIRRFPDPPIGQSEDLAAFIDELSTLGAVHIRHWHFPEPAMAEPLPALAQLAIPLLTCGGDLAAWLKINSAQLAWLADEHRYQRRASSFQLAHYHYTWIPKRSGAYRLLEAPKAGLKLIQRRILHEIVDKIPVHDAAHGFRRGRSVLTFAAAHADRDVVLRLDLADFFATITEARVRAIFQSLGYPNDVARTLAGLCCTPTPISVLSARPPARSKEEIAERSTQRQRLAASHLPQGAPTSPALANLVAYRLDQRLSALATARDARYTRYADDLAFSGSKYLAKHSTDFIANVAAIAADEGFSVRFRKTRVMQRAVRQQLGGIVVNVRPNLVRADLDLLEAILFNCVRHGATSQNRAGHHDFRSHLAGRVAWAEHAGTPARAARCRKLYEHIAW